MNRLFGHAIGVLAFALMPATAVAQPPPAAPPTAELRDRALGELQQDLSAEQKWVKVHAAEALLALGYGQGVQSLFQEELNEHGHESAYRIGVWRVLCQASQNEGDRQQYIEKIRRAYFDPTSPDPVYAVETLGKIQYVIPEAARSQFQELAQDESAEGAPYRRWVLAVSGTDDDVRFLAKLLDSADPAVRGATAYCLRHLASKLPSDVIAELANLAESGRFSPGGVYLASAAYVTLDDAAQTGKFRELLGTFASSSSPEDRREVAAALAAHGNKHDLPLLLTMLDDPQPDVRIAAALAVLRIERRQSFPLQVIDWLVLALYAAGLIGMGLYHKHKTKTAEDYLLGGRSMKPWAVGLSYFAALFSVISYLAYPGEMIRYGPMILSMVLAYPFVYLVGSRFLIPFIMRLRVTSAYEILEQRFGLSVRMLGASLFLALRLVWMAVIVYATSKSVLVPLLRLSDAAIPWVCVGLGTLTVLYTSMGGLPAVIWTDVTQTFILLFGAVLSMVSISVSMGGVSAWWPDQWAATWESPKFWFDPSARVTMASAMLSSFVWYVCTAGSDQIAIQRYLATRDAQAARRMFGISLCCDGLVTVLLAALGLALLAYFQMFPHMLPDGETLVASADRLLPQYIVKGLPAGISGLIVAGLLSAAMSALSSGLNACCSVITVDWIDRFRKKKLHGMNHVHLAQRVSWLVGMTIVSLSFLAAEVPGNLLEVANKLANLFTGPLFVLFFMAMFVPWATTFGTWVAAAASTAIAVAIAYLGFLGLSFLWITPASLLTGIALGCLTSVLPFGPRRPMLQASEW